MIALNGMHSDISGQFYTFVGIGIITHKIAKIQNSVRSAVKVINHRLKSLDVGVDI
jgi:hypothetical protein